MSLLVIVLTAIGLAMDAFAVALVSGRVVGSSRALHALRLGAAFGLAQMIMPVIGWIMVVKLKHWILSVDHWIAFIVLLVIGLKMIRESFPDKDDCEKKVELMTNRRLFMLSLATSIDALAVGVTFAFLDCAVILTSLIIGFVTFLIATAGAFIGCICCCVWGRWAERLGGIILILIAVKILLEHLFSG